MKVKDEDIKNALSLLDKVTGGDASEWYEFRGQKEHIHIVDPNTGKWVSQFKGASGKTYYIRSPHQGIGMKRYTELMKRLPAIGFDDTFATLSQHVQDAIEAANTVGSPKPKLSDLFQCLANMNEGIRRNDRQWQMSFILCTLFIVTKDEDTSTWSFEDAQIKVEDWNKSQIHEQDFFFLVMYWRLLLAKWYEQLPDRIRKVVAEWSPLT